MIYDFTNETQFKQDIENKLIFNNKKLVKIRRNEKLLLYLKKLLGTDKSGAQLIVSVTIEGIGVIQIVK